MSFFKNYNGTSDRRLARIETLIWVLVYGGLLSIVVGLFMPADASDGAAALMVVGALAAGAGVVLVYVRSRLRERS